jgi:hypothetical protein
MANPGLNKELGAPNPSAGLLVAGAKAFDFSEARRAVGDVGDHRVGKGDLPRMKGDSFQHLVARTAFPVGVGEPFQAGSAQQFEQLFI